jgi:hypothetical protein
LVVPRSFANLSTNSCLFICYTSSFALVFSFLRQNFLGNIRFPGRIIQENLIKSRVWAEIFKKVNIGE